MCKSNFGALPTWTISTWTATEGNKNWQIIAQNTPFAPVELAVFGAA